MKELIIDAKTENLGKVLEFVDAELSKSECTAKVKTHIAIAVEEVFINISNYAYRPDVGGVVIRISVCEDVRMEFEDKGKPYNPLEKEDPDVNVEMDEREIGGLGIFMVKKIMDTVEYRNEDGKNILIIRKTFI